MNSDIRYLQEIPNLIAYKIILAFH